MEVGGAGGVARDDFDAVEAEGADEAGYVEPGGALGVDRDGVDQAIGFADVDHVAPEAQEEHPRAEKTGDIGSQGRRGHLVRGPGVVVATRISSLLKPILAPGVAKVKFKAHGAGTTTPAARLPNPKIIFKNPM